MTNQNDNRIEALRNDAEALNTLMKEFQNKLSSLDISPDALVSDEESNPVVKNWAVEKVEAKQRELIDKIATLEAGIEEHEVSAGAIRKKRKALQKKVEKIQKAKFLLVGRLKTARAQLEKLGGEINTTEVFDEVVTILPDHVDEGARLPTYHVSKTGTDLGPDWSDKWRDKRGNRDNA